MTDLKATLLVGIMWAVRSSDRNISKPDVFSRSYSKAQIPTTPPPGESRSTLNFRGTTQNRSGTATARLTLPGHMRGRSSTFTFPHLRGNWIRLYSLSYGSPGIWQAEANLDTGKVGEFKLIWEGTGGMVRSIPRFHFLNGELMMAAGAGGPSHLQKGWVLLPFGGGRCLR
jgi:hypothetical protein